MADPNETTNALLAVEASAAHLVTISQSQDEEFRRLLCEIAQNLRLITLVVTVAVCHDSLAA